MALTTILFIAINSISPGDTYYARKISESLNKEIKSDELIKTSSEKKDKTYFYLDSNENTVSIFSFVNKKIEYSGSIDYNELVSNGKREQLFKWNYHDSENGSLIWGIVHKNYKVEINEEVYSEQDFIQLENDFNIFFIKSKTPVKFPINVKLTK